jgi:hypothetical protein
VVCIFLLVYFLALLIYAYDNYLKNKILVS